MKVANSPQVSTDTNPLATQLAAVEECLQARLNSTTSYPPELTERLLHGGGKRIRPLLLLATFESIRASQGLSQKIRPEDLHQLGAVAELVHTATLFHDDVIDHSIERRHMPSAQVLHGNKIAILVGDFVYAEAFARLMERAFLYPSQRLAKTIQQLVEGEIVQHEIILKRDFDRTQLLEIARLKTASLFAWCAETGAWATGRNDLLAEAFAFGHHLGLAFQLIDDVADTLAASQHMTNEFCHEFVASAPSFPVLLLCEQNSGHSEIWKKLPQQDFEIQKEQIGLLIEGCKDQALLQKSSQLITETLDLATDLAERLGNSSTLQLLIEQLQKRASRALTGQEVS